MKRILVCCVALFIGLPSFGGGAGLMIKGVFHSWDDVARMALKASGRNASDDAVKAAAKTIKNVAGKYGDDIAEASTRGGIEVAEQATKRGGGRFLQLVKVAGNYSDDSLRFLALHTDDVVKYSAKYGDDVVLLLNAKAPGLVPRAASVLEKRGVNGVQSAMRAMADLPTEDIPRVVGALEKNPSVAREFVEHLVKGGKYFVDKLFSVNAKQIMAGGLTASMIVMASGASSATQDAAQGMTAPYVATANAISQQMDTATAIVRELDDEAKKAYVENVQRQTGDAQKHLGNIVGYPMIILACFVGVALLLFVVRKTSSSTIRQQKALLPKKQDREVLTEHNQTVNEKD